MSEVADERRRERFEVTLHAGDEPFGVATIGELGSDAAWDGDGAQEVQLLGELAEDAGVAEVVSPRAVATAGSVAHGWSPSGWVTSGDVRAPATGAVTSSLSSVRPGDVSATCSARSVKVR